MHEAPESVSNGGLSWTGLNYHTPADLRFRQNPPTAVDGSPRGTVYARLERGVAELNSRFGGLPSPDESQFIWAEIFHLQAHHSTALEGNTLVLREVAALLDKGRAVGAKPLKEYMEVQGYGQAAQWSTARRLSPRTGTTAT